MASWCDLPKELQYKIREYVDILYWIDVYDKIYKAGKCDREVLDYYVRMRNRFTFHTAK